MIFIVTIFLFKQFIFFRQKAMPMSSKDLEKIKMSHYLRIAST